MTVQYEGNEVYTIYYKHEVHRLPVSLINEIQEFDFIHMTDKESITQLKDKILELEYELQELQEKLDEMA